MSKKVRIVATVEVEPEGHKMELPLNIVVPIDDADRVLGELNSRYYLFGAFFDSLHAKYGRDTHGNSINIVFGTQDEDDVDDDY